MNVAATSQEAILGVSRELIRQQGWSAVSIRSVAAACGVSVGTVYNYFDSKSALVGAVVESVWHEIFHRSDTDSVFSDTLSCISWMYERMERGMELYPDVFTLHSLAFLREDKLDGRLLMQRTWQHILEELGSVISQDARVRADAFDGSFTVEAFASVLFSLMLSAPLRKDYDQSAVLEVARRVLY